MSVVPRILWLDAVRGACALCVLLHHTLSVFTGLLPALSARSPGVALLASWLSHRNTEAVLVFFVLSGVSIRFSIEPRGLDDALAVDDYIYRRLRRILPLYWFSLALSGVLGHYVAHMSGPAFSPWTLLGNLLFLQTASGVRGQWVLPYAGNAALWSLSFELFFYAAYPWLWRRWSRAATRMGVVLAAAGLGLALGQLHANPLALFLGAGPIWYFGVELAQRKLTGRTSLPLAAYLLLWLGLLGLRLGPHGALFHGLLVGCSLLLLGLAALAVPGEGLARLQRWSRTAPLAWLVQVGDASYALYLLHVPVLCAWAARAGRGIAPAFAAVSCSVLLAFATERVARRLRWSWLRRGAGLRSESA